MRGFICGAKRSGSGSSDSQSGRAGCFKRVEVKELCPKGAEGEAAKKIERMIREAAAKRLLPKLKQEKMAWIASNFGC